MEDKEVVDTSCGYVCCKPSWLQKLANATTYLVVITLFAVVQGFAVNGIGNSNIVMYEKRYGLTSQESSLIAVVYDIVAGIVVIVLGYYGATGHQPRMLAISILMMSLGTFVMSMAHFIAPPYNPSGFNTNSTGLQICSLVDNSLSTTCEVDTPSGLTVNPYMVLLIVGQMLNGYTGAAVFSIGVTYLEISTPAAQAALYLGILAGGTAFGPAIGFVAGGSLLRIYVDFPASPPDGLTPEDPAWVGAWWLGLLISTGLCTILSLIMFLFPKELPATARVRAEKVSEAQNDGTEAEISKPGFGMTWRHLPRATLYLLKNACFMCLTVVDAVELGVLIGFATFLAKVVSIQFNISPAWSSTLSGLIAVPAAVIGEIAGGVIIRKWNFNLKQILQFALVCSILSISLAPIYLTRCPETALAGVTTGYSGAESPSELGLDAECNDNCGCSTTLYDPVCADGVQYFSSCYAGCSESFNTTEDGKRVYENCSCTSAPVVSGVCEQPCNLLYTLFVPVCFLQLVFTFMVGTPTAVATLRVVPEKLRTYGLAVHWVFLRYLGSIPGPLLFGAMLDASCAVWKEECGERGACWIYDHYGLALRVTLLAGALKLISIIFNAAAIFAYKPPDKSAAENGSNVDMKRIESAASMSSMPSSDLSYHEAATLSNRTESHTNEAYCNNEVAL